TVEACSLAYVVEFDLNGYGYVAGGDEFFPSPTASHRWTDPYATVRGAGCRRRFEVDPERVQLGRACVAPHPLRCRDVRVAPNISVPNPGLSLIVLVGDEVQQALENAGIRGLRFVKARA